eukprot:566528-Heterocapsa_arctica.AAC.1
MLQAEDHRSNAAQKEGTDKKAHGREDAERRAPHGRQPGPREQLRQKVKSHRCRVEPCINCTVENHALAYRKSVDACALNCEPVRRDSIKSEEG